MILIYFLIHDSLAVISNTDTSADMLDIAKQTIQYQNNLATMGIIIIIALTTLIAGATLFANIYISNKKISDIKKSIEFENQNKLNKISKDLENEVKAKLNNDMKVVINDVTVKIDKMIGDTKVEITKKLKFLEAERARIFAVINQKEEDWFTSMQWWCEALVSYSFVDQPDMIRTSVDQMIVCLENIKDLSPKNCEKVKEYFHFIPPVLSTEQDKIEKELKRFEGRSK